MMMLVSYDVAKDEKGEKRLRHVAKILENQGSIEILGIENGMMKYNSNRTNILFK